MSPHAIDKQAIRTHFKTLATLREAVSVSDHKLPVSVIRWDAIPVPVLVVASAIMNGMDVTSTVEVEVEESEVEESEVKPIWADDATATTFAGSYAVYTADVAIVGRGVSLMTNDDDVTALRSMVRSEVKRQRATGKTVDMRESASGALLDGAEVARLLGGLLGVASGVKAPEATVSRSQAPVVAPTYGGATRAEDLEMIAADKNVEAVVVRDAAGERYGLLRPTGETVRHALSWRKVQSALSIYYSDDRVKPDLTSMSRATQLVLSCDSKGNTVVEKVISMETLARGLATIGVQDAGAKPAQGVKPALLRVPVTSKSEIEEKGYEIAVANRLALATVKAQHAALLVLGGKPTTTMSDARSWETGEMARLMMASRGEDALIEGARDNAQDNFNALK